LIHAHVLEMTALAAGELLLLSFLLKSSLLGSAQSHIETCSVSWVILVVHNHHSPKLHCAKAASVGDMLQF
jgi:hypothetical protein